MAQVTPESLPTMRPQKNILPGPLPPIRGRVPTKPHDPHPSVSSKPDDKWIGRSTEVRSSLAEDAESDKVMAGLSSRTTVMTIAGCFVVGLTFFLSGIIVICTQHHQTEFLAISLIFIFLGIGLFVACLILQKKNLVKLVHDIEHDLYLS